METNFLNDTVSTDDWFCYTEAFNENLLLALDQLEIMGTECALNGDRIAAQFLAGIRAAVAEFARVRLHAASPQPRGRLLQRALNPSTGGAPYPRQLTST